MDWVIRVKNLSVKLGETNVLNNVSFEVKKGEFTGIIGPNGAGKTTLIKALLKQIPFTGEVKINGKIGYVPQLSTFNREFPLSVYEFVKLPIMKEKNWRQQVDILLRKVGLEGFGEKLVGKLSGGEYQRISLARALINKPDVLILDEPESGIDEMGKARFYDLLNELRVEKGITILMVSHDIGMIFEKCTNIMCLNKTLHCHGPTKEIEPLQVKKIFGEFDIWIRSENHFEIERKQIEKE
ncbi:MAG: metal ABC transporter ATP-binding protein [Fervidobacterium sp.]|nr:metal ABC transporter ATP-binding protein [Fervidobacterium sp.]